MNLDELVAKWESDLAEAGAFNKRDLRPERFIHELKARTSRTASSPTGGGVMGEEIAAYRTGKSTLIRLIAEGEWSAGDIERLYELIGAALRDGAFDTTQLAKEPT